MIFLSFRAKGEITQEMPQRFTQSYHPEKRRIFASNPTKIGDFVYGVSCVISPLSK